MNITKKIKEQGNQAGVLLADAIDNTVELDLSQYSTGNPIVVLSAPNDSYPDAIIDENIAKKALSWKTDPSKIFLLIKVRVESLLFSFIVDKRIYFGQDTDIDLDGDKVEEAYTSTIFMQDDSSLAAFMCSPQIDIFGPGNTIRLKISITEMTIPTT